MRRKGQRKATIIGNMSRLSTLSAKAARRTGPAIASRRRSGISPAATRTPRRSRHPEARHYVAKAPACSGGSERWPCVALAREVVAALLQQRLDVLQPSPPSRTTCARRFRSARVIVSGWYGRNCVAIGVALCYHDRHRGRAMYAHEKQIICDAIREKRLLSFKYKLITRRVEPHLLGYDQDGALMLIAWQLSGGSGQVGELFSFRTNLACHSARTIRSGASGPQSVRNVLGPGRLSHLSALPDHSRQGFPIAWCLAT